MQIYQDRGGGYVVTWGWAEQKPSICAGTGYPVPVFQIPVPAVPLQDIWEELFYLKDTVWHCDSRFSEKAHQSICEFKQVWIKLESQHKLQLQLRADVGSFT